MASTTPILGLTKPAGSEPLDVSMLNGNMDIIDEIFSRIYPVGAIYMTAGSENPGDLFGGTWEKIEDRFLVASGTAYAAGATGGSASQTLTISEDTSTHTLTTQEMPNHSHTFTAHGSISGGEHNHTFSGTTSSENPGVPASYSSTQEGDGGPKVTSTATTSHSHTFSGTTSNATPSMTFTGTADETTAAAGGGTGHSHSISVSKTIQTLPPYLSVNVWQRTE